MVLCVACAAEGLRSSQEKYTAPILVRMVVAMAVLRRSDWHGNVHDDPLLMMTISDYRAETMSLPGRVLRRRFRSL
jgi:hypothetical protein